jgi:hypothetical protein
MRNGLPAIANIGGCVSVAFTGKCQDRVWATLDAPWNHACEMHAEKGKTGVRNGVDQVPAKMLCTCRQFIALTALRNDPYRGTFAGHDRDSVTLESRAIDDRSRSLLASCGLQHNGPQRIGTYSIHARLQVYVAPTVFD